MIGMIAAVTTNGVIGIENRLPFNYPEDLQHFRKTTANSTVIMGRNTYNSIGRPLPKRTNIVISSKKVEVDGVITCNTMVGALAIQITKEPNKDIWLIGGAGIYEEGMDFANKIMLTLTPDVELRTPAVKFPFINPARFELKTLLPLCPENPLCLLKLATYERITQ